MVDLRDLSSSQYAATGGKTGRAPLELDVKARTQSARAAGAVDAEIRKETERIDSEFDAQKSEIQATQDAALADIAKKKTASSVYADAAPGGLPDAAPVPVPGETAEGIETGGGEPGPPGDNTGPFATTEQVGTVLGNLGLGLMAMNPALGFAKGIAQAFGKDIGEAVYGDPISEGKPSLNDQMAMSMAPLSQAEEGLSSEEGMEAGLHDNTAGMSDAGGGGGGCIIVTACTDRFSPEVDLTRFCRDTFLDPVTLRGYYAIAARVVPYIKSKASRRGGVKRILVDRLMDYGAWFLGNRQRRQYRTSKFTAIFFLTLCHIAGFLAFVKIALFTRDNFTLRRRWEEALKLNIED